MNLREGRIGTRETINVIGIALLINGMFSIDSAKAYANGNSTFISLPLALAQMCIRDRGDIPLLPIGFTAMIFPLNPVICM